MAGKKKRSGRDGKGKTSFPKKDSRSNSQKEKKKKKRAKHGGGGVLGGKKSFCANGGTKINQEGKGALTVLRQKRNQDRISQKKSLDQKRNWGRNQTKSSFKFTKKKANSVHEKKKKPFEEKNRTQCQTREND